MWHVDDMKISHAEDTVVSAIIKKLNNIYGKTVSGQDVPLTVKRRRIHEYLGMVLDYTLREKVQIDMREYICKILSKLDHLDSGC